VDDRKVAGILAEGRPQEGWAVLGIGVNVALRVADLPAELHATAGTLGRKPADVEPFLANLLTEIERVLDLAPERMLESWRSRDALLGRPVRWSGGEGTAAGIDGEGRLVVDLEGGGRTALDAGEVHLQR
jgi:BirA family transcriptional regulator, biotin operon repressor / biotin---[acetyl-CoA-carboxylase] ligase